MSSLWPVQPGEGDNDVEGGAGDVVGEGEEGVGREQGEEEERDADVS